LAQIVSKSRSQSGRGPPSPRVGRLMIQLRAQLQAAQPASHRPCREAEVPGVSAPIELTSPAAESRPLIPALLNPKRQQQRLMVIAAGPRARRQKHSREKRGIPTAVALMQKTVFGRELDIAEPGVARTARRMVVSQRHHRRQLQIGSRPVVEIDSRGATVLIT